MHARVAESDLLKVAIDGDAALVKLDGRGTFKIAPTLKQFAALAVDRDHCRRFVFDMRDCGGMDSTFMGVIAGIALRLQRAGAGPVAMVCVSPKTLALMTTLGLDRLLRIVPDATAPAGNGQPDGAGPVLAPLETCGTSRRDNVQAMLDAHRDLASLSVANAERFRDVIDYLSQDVRDLTTAPQ